MKLKVTATTHPKILPIGREITIATPDGPFMFILDNTGIRARSICDLQNAQIKFTYNTENAVEINGFLGKDNGDKETTFEHVRFTCE